MARDYARAVLGFGEEENEKKEKPETEMPEYDYAKSLLSSGMSDMPDLSSVVAREEFMGDPANKEAAGFITHMTAGIADDPQTQIKVYAKSRFPFMPEQERLKRYGINQGEIVFLGDDGKLYQETPDTWMQNLKRTAAQTGSHLPSILTSIIGSSIGGIKGGMAGAALGEAVRKGIAHHAFGEPQTPTGNVYSMGKEALFELGGELGGRAIGAGINKLGAKRGGKLAQAAGRDRGAIDAAKTREMELLGKSYDIDLYPPSTTGSKKLIDKFNLLGDLEASADIIQGARRKTADQIDDAVYRQLDKISRPSTSFEAGAKGVEAAKGALQRPVEVRKIKAGKFYRRAFKNDKIVDKEALKQKLKSNNRLIQKYTNVKPTVDVDAMAQELKAQGVPSMRILKESDKAYSERITNDYKRIIGKTPPQKGGDIDTRTIKQLQAENAAIKQTLSGKPPAGFNVPVKKKYVDTSEAENVVTDLLSETVKGDPSYAALVNVGRMLKEANGDLRKLHRVKISGIDNVLNKTKTSRTMTRELKKVKDKLTDAMDSAFPDYKKARQIYSTWSEEVETQARKTIVSSIAGLEGDQVVKASKRIFSAADSTPETVLRAKTLIARQNPDAWRKLLRSYLQDTFEGIKGQITSDTPNIGGQMWKRTFGNKRQRKILQAAMEPMEFENWAKFMKVLERSGLIFGKESATATRQVALEEMKRTGSSPMLTAVTTPMRTPKRLIADRVNEALLGRYNKNLADAMISEEAAAQLQKMYQLKPGSKELIKNLGIFLGLVTGHKGSDWLNDQFSTNRYPLELLESEAWRYRKPSKLSPQPTQ